MSGCTETGKPRIAILMAVYEPRMDWLREQLLSLDAQTYPNLMLYIRDDCSPTVPFEEIQSCVQDCIHAFPYEVKRNEKNFGSNGTFERLTREAEGDYFAYCDQDDVWLPEKLEVLERAMAESDARLACSDMYVIDAEGKRTANSIKDVRRHHVFKRGSGLAPELLFHNFVTGCTMLVYAADARAAVPFCPYMVHDHYLALWCAERGKILSIEKPLICYRIHSGNQTNLLSGVSDKSSYGNVRICKMLKRLRWLQENFPCDGKTQAAITDGIAWAAARKTNWAHAGGKRTIWKYRKFSMLPSLFEIFANWIPEPLFRLMLSAGRHNLI